MDHRGTVIQVMRQQYVRPVAVEPVAVVVLPRKFDAEQ
jgi:hypothetical protein